MEVWLNWLHMSWGKFHHYMRHSLNSRCFPCTREFTIPPFMSETFINDHKCMWVWVQPKESSQKVMRWPLLWAASFGVSWDHVQSPMRKNLLSFTLFAQSVTSSWLEKDPVLSNSSPGLKWESVSQNTWPEEEWHHRAGSARVSRGPMQSESDKDKILAWQRRHAVWVCYIVI